MSIRIHKVFLVSDALCAFIDRAHPKHEQAAAFFRYFAQEEYQLYLDIYTIIDAYNQIYKDISPSLAKDFLRSLSLSNINILYPDESDIKAAVKTLITYRSTDLTFPEALRATLADRKTIAEICTLGYLHPLFGLTLFYLPI